MAERFEKACREGKREEVEQFLREQPSEINSSSSGKTGLYHACTKNHVKVIELLLQQENLNPNKSFLDGATPLYAAIRKAHLEAVSLLLQDARVDINKPNYNGNTPLYSACEKDRREIAALLLVHNSVDPNRQNEALTSPLCVACERGNCEIVSLLVRDERVDVNLIDLSHRTPLYVASSRGDLKMVEALVSSGKRLDALKAPWFSGSTPRQRAKWDKNYAIAQLLEDYEQNPDQTVLKVREKLGMKGIFLFFSCPLPPFPSILLLFDK